MAKAPDLSELEALAQAKEKATEDLAVPSWPKPMAKEAFHGDIGELVKKIEPHTESDPVAVLVQLLVAFGNLVGRDPYFPVEADRHTMNLFVVLVGSSAKARKGTSWGHVRRLCLKLDPSWSVAHGLSSGEGVIHAVRDPVMKEKPWTKKDGDAAEPKIEVVDEGVTDKRLLVMEGEFAIPLRVMAREGNTLSGVLRNAWDSGHLRSMTKNSAEEATDAHISIVAHITSNELHRHFSETDAANGFGNRFLWISVRRSKSLPEGGALVDSELTPFVERLTEALVYARQAGRLLRSSLATKLWSAVYDELSEGKPGLSGSMIMRAEAQVMRLSSIYALLDRSKVIRVEHLLAGLAVWDYAEESARYIFEDSLGDPVAEQILKAVEVATADSKQGGLTRSGIRDLFGRNKDAKEIKAALGRLLELGLVHRVQEQTGGRPVERWVASSGMHDKNDGNDPSSGAQGFRRLGRLGRTYLETAKAVLTALQLKEEVEVPSSFDIPPSNGATENETGIPF